MIGKPSKKRKRRRKRRRSYEDQVVGLCGSMTSITDLERKSICGCGSIEGLAKVEQLGNKMSFIYHNSSCCLSPPTKVGFCCLQSQSETNHRKQQHQQPPPPSAFSVLPSTRRPPVLLRQPRPVEATTNSLLLITKIVFLILSCTRITYATNDTINTTNTTTTTMPSKQTNSLTVQTKHGKFRGALLTDSSMASFDSLSNETGAQDQRDGSDAIVGYLGIRYASAPIKRLRFMPPTAYYYSTNIVHDAQQFGPICMQRFPIELSSASQQRDFSFSPSNRVSTQAKRRFRRQTDRRATGTASLVGGASLDAELKLASKLMPSDSFAYLRPLLKRLAQRHQSEDCLNLNIYVPQQALERANNYQQQQRPLLLLPVLVIIHGESFDFGAGSTINGFKIVQQQSERQKLIAVTFNYRLNILGFPPKLMGATRGNLGLMDQVAALHWIKDNIRSFGGSPSNITIMGTKRAATFVNLLMLSPLAKGLFQRAIMEDGSALSPLVAGSQQPLPAPPSSVKSHNNQYMNFGGSINSQPTLSPAVQHVRLLAKLCDCPIYLLPSSSSYSHINGTLPSDFSTSTMSQQQAASNNSAIAMAITMPTTGKIVSHQSRTNLADETKANAQTFECLRHKPVELLTQRLPLDLLHLDQATGQIYIDSQWQTMILSNSNTHQTSDTNRNADESLARPVGDSLERQSQWVTIEAAQLKELVTMAQDLELTKGSRPVAPPSESLNSYPDLDPPDASGGLFSAIYAPPSASARPIFGPAIDGTIVPDEDIATLMLRPSVESPFSQRDLLIGLSRPIISPSFSMDLSTTPNERTKINHTDINITLGLDNPLYARISLKMQKFGLTSEQAIEMVSLFVRSFYRYHNQEITNSIINHYLSSIGLRHQLRLKNRKSPGIEESEEVSRHRLSSERQVLILESLLESFQDALVNVPVIKTALIHSSRQLDTLIDSFVAQTFDKWKRRQTISSIASLETRNGFDRNQLMENFSNFAKTLMMDPSWPQELRVPSSREIDTRTGQATKVEPLQPKATYLYQLDSRALIKLLNHSIRRLELESSAGNRNANLNTRNSGWRSLLAEFRSLLSDLDEQSAENQKPLSLDCGLELYEDDFEQEEGEVPKLSRQLHRWLCSKFNSLIGTFVVSGHMRSNENDQSTELQRPSIGELVVRFEESCINNRAGVKQEDHHSVTAAALILQTAYGEKCRRRMQHIAFNYIVNELTEQQDRSPWTVFNLFQQEVATLPGVRANDSLSSLYQLKSIHETDGVMSFDEKSTFLSRASFWSNFIPALNCSKTQPVVPNSLLMASNLAELTTNHTNSPLLNLNLAFNCQNGAKTALSTIESTVDTIKRQLGELQTLWLTNRANQSENHHSLRMVNFNQTNEEAVHEQQHQENQLELRGQNGGSLSLLDNSGLQFITSGGFGGAPSNGTINWSNVIQSLIYSQLVLISCALLVTLTLASGAFAVLKQRKRQKRISLQQQHRQQEQHQQQANFGVEATIASSTLGTEVANSSNGFEPTSLVKDQSLVSSKQQQHHQQVELLNFDATGPISAIGSYQLSAEGQMMSSENRQSGSRCPSHSSLTTPTPTTTTTTTTTTNNTNNNITRAVDGVGGCGGGIGGENNETILSPELDAYNQVANQIMSLQVSNGGSLESFVNSVAYPPPNLNGNPDDYNLLKSEQMMRIMVPIVTADGQYGVVEPRQSSMSRRRHRQERNQMQQVVGQQQLLQSFSLNGGSDADQQNGLAWQNVNGYLDSRCLQDDGFANNSTNTRNHSASSAQSSSFTSSLSTATNVANKGNGQTSTIKKRVKITIPDSSGLNSSGRRGSIAKRITNNDLISDQIDPNNIVATNGNYGYEQNSRQIDTNYCPLHGGQTVYLSDGPYETEYLAPSVIELNHKNQTFVAQSQPGRVSDIQSSMNGRQM